MKILLALLCAAFTCLGVETEWWTHNSASDYESATLKNLVLRSDGRLTLAPRFVEVHDASMPYLWAAAEDSKGRVYTAGGGPETGGKIFEIAPDAPPGSRAKVIATFTEFLVQALAVDKQDRLYAATAPDGKVYRIVNGKAEVFYEPKAKYIWALAFNSAGDLFVATGDPGTIHRVSPGGQGRVFYEAGQTHVRSLAVDSKQNIIAGTEPSGYIVSVNPAGQGFVLYQAPKREVTAVAVDPKGGIYVAAVGAKRMQPSGTAPPGPAPAPAPAAGAGTPATQRAANAPPAIPSMSPSMSGGSEVYRIEADGFTRKVWSHATDFVYAIAFDGEGKAVLGTGNQGKIIRLDSDLLSSVLVSASPTQITALASGTGGRIWVATGNIGKLYALGPQTEASGSLESVPLDSEFFSYWGRAHLSGSGLSGAVLESRSGNHDDPDKGWSPWTAVTMGADGGRVAAPPARFLQYRLTLHAPAQGAAPSVREIEIAHQAKNVAPVVEIVEVTPPNYKFPAQLLTLTPSTTLSLPSLRGPRLPQQRSQADSAVTMNAAKGFRGVRWYATDENGDALEAKVEIRGVNETGWKVLKDRTTERHFSWDGTGFADGEYAVRVTVSDAPDNLPQQALQSTMVSDPFLIDNTPPAISSLQAARAGSNLTLSWKAADRLNSIERAEYSVNGGEWTVVQPTTRLTDSLSHDYDLTIANAPTGEATVSVRLVDSFNNPATASVVVR